MHCDTLFIGEQYRCCRVNAMEMLLRYRVNITKTGVKTEVCVLAKALPCKRLRAN